MCGRFSLRVPPEDIAEHFGLEVEPTWEPRYNLAPTQNVGIVRAGSGEKRVFDLARWGLLPAGGPGPGHGPLLINARSETAHEKSPFRLSLEHRRCLVPADGFYEWRQRDRWRQPYRIGLRDSDLFSFAGLWDEWHANTGESLVSCTIITTTPNSLLASIHDRMPVLVSPTAYECWLDGDNPVSKISHLLRPFPASAMKIHAVSDRVNSIKHDDPDCIRPVAEPLEFDLFS